jgi:hypothetical protein
MDKETVLLQLDHLESKLKRLLQAHSSIQTELENCKEVNRGLKQVIEQQNEELKNFQNQHKISKIVSSIAEGSQNSTELKFKINEFIKEIDKCIAHLSE